MIIKKKAFNEGIKILSQRNKTFRALYNQIGIIKFEQRLLNFEALVKIIVNQQLSNTAANTIFERIKNNYPNEEILLPELLLNSSNEKLRSAGLSYSKINFIKSVANECINKSNIIDEWEVLEDQDLLVEIMKLKGFGPWSANIVLLFYLGRANVFPIGDNTLNKAYKHLYKVDLLNKPDHIK